MPVSTTCTHAYVPIESSSLSFMSAHFFLKRSGSSIVQQNAVTLHSSSPLSTPSRLLVLSIDACSAALGGLPPRMIEHDAVASVAVLVTSLTDTGSFSASACWNALASISSSHGILARPGTGGEIFLATSLFATLRASSSSASFLASSAPAFSFPHPVAANNTSPITDAADTMASGLRMAPRTLTRGAGGARMRPLTSPSSSGTVPPQAPIAQLDRAPTF